MYLCGLHVKVNWKYVHETQAKMQNYRCSGGEERERERQKGGKTPKEEKYQ